MSHEREFKPLAVAVMVISDTRSEADDVSGKVLVERLEKTGHFLHDKQIVPDDIYQIRSVASQWIS